MSGVGQRTAQLRLQWGRDITEASWETILENPCLNNVSALKEVSRTPHAEQPAVLAQLLKDGGKVIKPDRELKSLLRAWKGASQEARHRFLDQVTTDALRSTH